MGYASIARREDCLESLVAGCCINCGSGEGDMRQEWHGMTLYTIFSCDDCGYVLEEQVERKHNMSFSQK